MVPYSAREISLFYWFHGKSSKDAHSQNLSIPHVLLKDFCCSGQLVEGMQWNVVKSAFSFLIEGRTRPASAATSNEQTCSWQCLAEHQTVWNRTGFMEITIRHWSSAQSPIDPECYSGQCTHTRTGTIRNPKSGNGSQNLCQTTSIPSICFRPDSMTCMNFGNQPHWIGHINAG